jgi:hypothetical protein
MIRRARIEVIEKLDGEIKLKYLNKYLGYSTLEVNESQEECDSKMVNKMVEGIKPKQGKNLEFKIAGRTFLLWTKEDISTLG